MYQKKIYQNKMRINFCLILDILFMNSFLVLMFFKEGITKKNWSFNHIISKDIYKRKKYIKGLVRKMVNTLPKKFLCDPLSKIGVFDFLIS